MEKTFSFAGISGQILLESDRFCVDLKNVFKKKKKRPFLGGKL